MELISCIFLSAVFVLITHSIVKFWLIKKRLPPGPIPIPFVGNYFQCRKLLTHDLTLKLSTKFGSIFTIFVLNTPCIILTKYEEAKAIFGRTTFNSRSTSGFVHMVLGGVPGIGFGKYGSLWHYHREIMHNDALVEKLVANVDMAIDNMLAEGTINPFAYMRYVLYNLFSEFAYGKSWNLDDPDLLRIQRLNDTINEHFVRIMAMDALPFAEVLLPYLKYWPFRCVPFVGKVLTASRQLAVDRVKLLEQHRRTYVEAGTDTTASALNWFCLFMVMRPEFQEECFQAIKDAIGDRSPKLSDKSNLQLIEAALSETLRLRPPAPMGLPHTNTENANIGPYFIPKGSTVAANIYAMHIDPDVWTDPLIFDPRSHFLDEHGQLKHVASFAPFGFGRRICPGDQLSRNNSFLIATRLLQRVRLEPVEGQAYTMDYDSDQDMTMAALPYLVRVVPRE